MTVLSQPIKTRNEHFLSSLDDTENDLKQSDLDIGILLSNGIRQRVVRVGDIASRFGRYEKIHTNFLSKKLPSSILFTTVSTSYLPVALTPKTTWKSKRIYYSFGDIATNHALNVHSPEYRDLSRGSCPWEEVVCETA